MTSAYTQVNLDPAVFEISTPLLPETGMIHSKCYLIKCGKDALLIDSGAPSDKGAKMISQAMAELDVNPDYLRVFLTHLHFDHTGNVNQIGAPGTTIYSHEREFSLLYKGAFDGYASKLEEMILAGGFSKESIALLKRAIGSYSALRVDNLNVEYVCDGDPIRVGEHEFRVIETPGHTPGHLSLFHLDSGVLFGGDHVLFCKIPSVYLSPTGEDGVRSYLDSLRKVAGLGCSKLLAAHGAARRNVNARIEKIVQHYEGRAGEVASIICENPGATNADILKAASWNPGFVECSEMFTRRELFLARECIALTTHLEKAGIIRCEGDAEGFNRCYPLI